MMKKVLYGVALALLACGPVVTLQSCKDDVSDLKTQTEFNLKELQSVLSQRANDLEDLIKKNKADIATNKAAIETNKADIATNAGNIAANTKAINDLIADLAANTYGWATIQDVTDKIDEYNNTIKGNLLTEEQKGLLNQIEGALEDIEDLKTGLGDLKTEVGTKYNDLKKFIDNNTDSIGRLQGRVEVAEAGLKAMQSTINDIKDDLQDIHGELGDIHDEMGIMNDNLNNLGENVKTLLWEVNEIKTALNNLTGRVDVLEGRMDEVVKSLKQLTKRMDELVTGILIQGVNSPVFGDFSLPIGVKSNILFNWHGYNNDKEFDFPISEESYSATGAPGVDFTGAQTETIKSGFYPKNVELGTFYVTLNPLNHKFTDTKVQLVNSRGEAILDPVELTESNKLLYHGYSRAAEAGGDISSYLYEGKVTLDPTNNEQLESVVVRIDENLKSAMKDAVKDPTKRTAAHLLKAVYNQLSGILPAYGLKYDFGTLLETSDPESSARAYSVLSQYDLAVATARPLSYNFMAGEGTSKHLPIIDDIDNIVSSLKGKLEINIAEIKDGDISITMKPVIVSAEGVDLLMVIPDLTIIEDGVPGPSYTLVLSTKKLTAGTNENPDRDFIAGLLGTDYNRLTTYHYEQITGFDKIFSTIEGNINTSLTQSGKDISEQITKQINNNIIKKINSELQTQIDNVIEDLENKLDPYFDKANQAFHLYNRIAEKVNAFLKDPNAYLQVTALYNMRNGDLGFVSGSPTAPTRYEGNGKFDIYLTSYTGDLVVPAYKKFLAVTGYWDNEDQEVKSIPIAHDINDGKVLNKVYDGNKIRVTIDTSKFEDGKTYEFTYQAVDYSGWTSTRKFYIQINK